MRMQFGQHLQQKQSQILSPRMIQSMEILQLPLLALQERIDQELVENPVLEQNDLDPETPEVSEEREDSDSPTLEERELVVDNDSNNSDDFERMESIGSEVVVKTAVHRRGQRRCDTKPIVSVVGCSRYPSFSDILSPSAGRRLIPLPSTA